MPALLFERIGPGAALRRSFGLVKGRWWKVCVTLLVGVLLVSFLGGIIQGILLVVPSLLAEGNDAVAAFSSVVANTLGGVLTTPFTAAIVALIYFDQRVRKEGFDLQLLAEGMGTERDPNAPLPEPLIGPAVTDEQRAPGAVLAAAAGLDAAGAGRRAPRRQPPAADAARPRTGRRRRAGSRRSRRPARRGAHARREPPPDEAPTRADEPPPDEAPDTRPTEPADEAPTRPDPPPEDEPPPGSAAGSRPSRRHGLRGRPSGAPAACEAHRARVPRRGRRARGARHRGGRGGHAAPSCARWPRRRGPTRRRWSGCAPVDRVDGRPVDVAGSLRGAVGGDLRARLELLAAAPPSGGAGRRRRARRAPTRGGSSPRAASAAPSCAGRSAACSSASAASWTASAA